MTPPDNNNQPRVLVISSCGKSKKVSVPSPPSCSKLASPAGRAEALATYHRHLTPAGDLYTGPQPTAVREAIRDLRQICAVDHYIVSAGFGLVPEDTALPPYECAFSGKRKDVIEQMAQKLGIPEALGELVVHSDRYDTVYLALGKDYLTAVGGVQTFGSLGKEVVYFNHPTNLTDPFVRVDEVLVIGTEKSQFFAKPIGGSAQVKGTVLQNYAHDVRGVGHYQPFKTWFEAKMEEVGLPPTGLDLPDVGKRGPKSRYEGRSRGLDYRATSAVQVRAKSWVASQSLEDVTALNALCRNVGKVNPHDALTYTTWLARQETLTTASKALVGRLEEEVARTAAATEEQKGRARAEFVRALAGRVQQECPPSSINHLTYAMTYTILTRATNPKLPVILQLIQGGVVATKTTTKKGQKKTKLPKPSKLPEPVKREPGKVTLQLIQVEEEGQGAILTFTIHNSRPYPLQNLIISLGTTSRPQEKLTLDKNIPVTKAKGPWVDVQDGLVQLRFLKASMSGSPEVTEVRCWVGKQVREGTTEGLVGQITYDDTFEQIRAGKLFLLSQEV